MAVDNNLQLFNNDNLTIAASTALSSVGAEIELGRIGIGRNAQVVAFVQTPASAASSRDLFIDFEVALDGVFAAADATGVNPTVNTVATIHFETGFKGAQTRDIGLQIPWQEYVDADIEMRAVVRSPSTTVSADWDNVEVFVGYSESQHYGRLATVETLDVDI